MIRLAVRGVVVRRAQSLLAVIGLFVTLAGFAALTAGARSTTARLTGDLGQAWNTPFDLLVRPAGSAEPLEQSAGLIRPNYFSGIHGGITVAQLDRIKRVPDVTLAAPLAAVGAVEWPSAFQLHLPHDNKTRVYRIRSTITGQDGLSRYPVETRYIVVAPTGFLTSETGRLTIPGAAAPIICGYPVNCFAGTVCFEGRCEDGSYPAPGDANYYLPLLQPIQVAGIDPEAEATLTGLGHCLDAGRLLTGSDRPAATDDPEPAEVLPVMASTHAYLDQVLHVDVESADGTPSPPSSARNWTSSDTRQVPLEKLYRSYLRTSVHDYIDPWPIWSAGDVRYRSVGHDHLAVVPVRPDPGIYRRVNTFEEVGISDNVLVPPEAMDPWFRPVTEHIDTRPPGEKSPYRSKIWDVVGRYRPECLRDFDRLAGASLEAYAAPSVRTPDGQSILPSRALSDYVASPPLLLTTLAGARWLADPHRYKGQPGDAFISVIRVRVADTGTASEAAKQRLLSAALAIHDATGLRVDVVKGASTRSIAVDLPGGKFGRPPLTVGEQWSVKGVVVSFLGAVRTQDRVLLGLLLIDAAVLVGQSSYIGVRQRRQQLATLRALGWSPSRLAVLIELESLTIGIVAGIAALVTAVPILGALRVSMTMAAWAPPLGIGIAAIAAVPAAVAASRGSAAEAMSQPQPVRRSRPPRTVLGLAVRELRRVWLIETIVGAVAVAIGAAIAGLIVLVAASFRSKLDATVLGTALDTQVRPFHVVLAALTLAIGAAAASEVILLAWLSRRHELGVLKASGWSGARLARLVCWQALAIGMVGAALAVPPVVVGGHVLHADATPVALATTATVGACALATLVAAVVPAVIALRSPARELLATQ